MSTAATSWSTSAMPTVACRSFPVSFLPSILNAKRLELLAGLLPKGRAVLNLGDPTSVIGMQSVEAAGRSLGLVLHAAYASTPAEIDAAFVSARKLRVAGINVLNSPFLYGNRARMFELAANSKLPAIYQWPEAARDGGLMSYGPSLTAMNRHSPASSRASSPAPSQATCPSSSRRNSSW